MSETTVSEAVARPARTAIQVVPSAAITEFVDAFLYDMTDRQYAALVVVLTLAFGWAQAAIENARGKGLWLRDVPPKRAPVKDERPRGIYGHDTLE
jgi:hypothetical protein